MNFRIRQYIDKGYTVLTASQRQARFLRMNYAAAMLDEGKNAWRTPLILPWKTWLTTCREESQEQAGTEDILLGQSQARCLWKSIIEADQSGERFQVNTIVDTAMRAYELCREWEIGIFPDDVFLNGDALAFRRWAGRYRARLGENNWIDSHGIPEYLQSSGYRFELPGIVVYGYDRLTPQQQSLLNYIKDKGCDVVLFEPDQRNQSVRYHALPEHPDELLSAASWARQRLEEEPDAGIGVVIPDLEQKRGQVTAVFDDILNPEWVLQGSGSTHRLYSIAPGRPLTAYPVIHAALEILSLGHQRQTIQRLEFLLRSSFIKGADSEAGKRARFYAALRKTGEPAWQLNTLLEYLDRFGEYMPMPDGLVTLLKEHAAFMDDLPKRQSPRAWSETFAAWLKRFGWPGDRAQNSSEYQTVAEWRESLLELAGLGTVTGNWSYNDALKAMKDVLDNRNFQPETVETPVQVSGLPGLAGMEFDYLWVCGIHDLSWPGPAINNPFIPLELQREAGIPGSTADLALQQCMRETRQLIRSTANIVFSFAETEEDTAFRPSAVLTGYLSDLTEPPGGAPVDYKRVMFAARELETFVDDIAPVFAKDDKVSGGTGILTDQSACPFRAYARHRLHAAGLDAIDIGLDPAVRGLLVHAVMQGVWKLVGDAATLKAMTTHKLDALVRAEVADVVRRQARLQPETFTTEFRRLESRRLERLVKEWMAIEKLRPPFTVRAMEMRHVSDFHGLHLRMRIDRLDQLADGGLVVIDYKTGEVSPRKWRGERPEEPQLPLYAITLDGDVKAVAFAGMKKGKLGYTGIGAGTGLIEGVETVEEPIESWEQQLNVWEDILGKLAEEYKQGRAGVTPTDKACRYCDLHSLCRIHEREWLISEDTDTRGEE